MLRWQAVAMSLLAAAASVGSEDEEVSSDEYMRLSTERKANNLWPPLSSVLPMPSKKSVRVHSTVLPSENRLKAMLLK